MQMNEALHGITLGFLLILMIICTKISAQLERVGNNIIAVVKMECANEK